MEYYPGETASARLLAELGRRFGMGPLRLDADHACTLRFARRLDICMGPSGDGTAFALFTVLGALPIGESGRALSVEMLKANFLWQQTAGATIALAPDGQVVLARRIALEGLTVTTLEQVLQTFVDLALTWQSRIAPCQE